VIVDDSTGVRTSEFRLDRNEATRELPALDLQPTRPQPFRHVFLQTYARMRAALCEAQAPCYVLLAAAPADSEVEPILLPLSVEGCTDAIAGRHDRCHLVLPEDPTVALRHLLVRAYIDGDGRPRVRLLDLCSRTGFQDEQARPCTGLSSDGHLFARVGTYHLLALLHDGEVWPDSAEEAWDALPERRVLEARPAQARAAEPLQVRPRLELLRQASGGHFRRHETTITRMQGPSHLQELDAGPEPRSEVEGALVFPLPGGDLSVQLSAEALSVGVLVGRYERCQLRTRKLLSSTSISRVHLCLLLDETGLWCIDTASSNGTTCDGRVLRSQRLGEAATLTLARCLEARWMRTLEQQPDPEPRGRTLV
jgi:hypothetical protein